MTAVGVLLIAFSPGLFWLWFFVRLDRLRPSSRRWIALTFLLGMVSTVPAGLVSYILIPEDPFSPNATLASISVSMLLVVGPVEETCKFLAIRLGVYRSLHFEEPMDGLVYGAAASLGFASLENLLYVLTYGPEVMLLRAPFSTLAHLVFGSLWGYGLGLRRVGHGARVVWGSLAGAAVFHGVFNILVLQSGAVARPHLNRGRRSRGVPAVQVGSKRLAVPLPTQRAVDSLHWMWTAYQSAQYVLPPLRSPSIGDGAC